MAINNWGMSESKPLDLELIADLCDRRLNGFASIDHESQLMDVVPALCDEVESLRERVKELEGQYIKKSSVLEELCDLRDYLITLEASRRDNDTRAAVRRLRLSISNIAHKKQLAETEAG